MTRLAISLLALPLYLAEVRTSRFQNRDSWVIETPTLRVSIMQSGGHIAEIVLKGAAEVNPLGSEPPHARRGAVRSCKAREALRRRPRRAPHGGTGGSQSLIS